MMSMIDPNNVHTKVKIAAFCDTNFLEGICHDPQGGSLEI
jgi:hypothetical protein